MAESGSNELPELTIEQVLRHYGAKDIPQGSGWKSMRCPFTQFHDDSNPSAAVNHGKNKFRCHACGTAGDPFDIIQTMEGMTFRESVEQAREVFGASGPPISQAVPRSGKRKPLGNERWKDILG